MTRHTPPSAALLLLLSVAACSDPMDDPMDSGVGADADTSVIDPDASPDTGTICTDCDAAMPVPATYVATHFVAPFESVPGATSDQDTEGGTPFDSATSPDSPCTFGEALSEAAPGDVVRLAPGVYIGERAGDRWTPAFAPVNSGEMGAPIIFFAENPAAYNEAGRTELRYTGEAGPALGFGIGDTEASDVVFDGFYLDASINAVAPSAGLVQFHVATRCEYRRMYFDQNTVWGSGDNYNMIFAQSNFDCVVSDCVFQGDGTYNAHHNLSSIQLYDSTNITIEHNEFHAVGTGVWAKGEYPAVPGENSAVIRFNLFTDMSGHAIELGRSDSDIGNTAYQNLSYGTGNGGGAIHFENSGMGYKNNRFYNNTVEGGISIRVVDGETGGGNAYYDNISFDGTLDADADGSDLEIRHSYGVTSLNNPYDYFERADYNLLWRSDGTPAHVSGHESSLFASQMTLPEFQAALTAAGVPEAARQTNTMESDPLFVDAAARDYRLRDEGQAALTASSTGGPVGCYITGMEEMGLRATPPYGEE